METLETWKAKLGVMTEGQHDLLVMAARLAEVGKKMIEDGEDEFEPCIAAAVGGIGDNRVLIPLGPLFTQQSRSRAPGFIRMMLSQLQAESYVLMSEAWMLDTKSASGIKPDENGHFELEVPISQDDRRISCLMLHGSNRQGDGLLLSVKIDERDPANRSVELAEPHLMEVVAAGDGEKQMGGRLHNMWEGV